MISGREGWRGIASGLLRLGQMFRAVSPAVINGMLAGIGVLILSAQFHVMVADDPRSTGLANLLSIPESIYKGIGGDVPAGNLSTGSGSDSAGKPGSHVGARWLQVGQGTLLSRAASLW